MCVMDVANFFGSGCKSFILRLCGLGCLLSVSIKHQDDSSCNGVMQTTVC